MDEIDANNNRIALFLRSVIPDFIMTWLLSACTVGVLSFSFYSGEAYKGNVVLVLSVTFIFLVVLFVGSWSKKALMPSAIVVGVLVIVFAIWGVSSSSAAFADGFTFNDVEENNLIFAMIISLVPIAVYLLSRRRAGVCALAILLVLLCGFTQYLYRDFLSEGYGDVLTIAMIFMVLAMFIFQGYKQSLLSSQRAGKAHFISASLFSIILGAVCVLFGCVVFYGAIAESDLTTPEWKPFMEIDKAPEIEYTGIYNRQQVKDKSQTSNNLDEDEEESNQNAENGSSADGADSIAGRYAAFVKGMTELASGYDPNDYNDAMTTIAYLFVNWWALILSVLFAIILALAILLKRHSRKKRLDKIADKPMSFKILTLYNFFISKFALMRAKKPGYLTPSEYAQASKRTLTSFAEDTNGTNFVDVTHIYERACIGKMPVTNEEYAKVVDYYNAFFKNARKRIGWPRWLFFKFWRI